MSKFSNDGHKLNHQILSPCTKRLVTTNLEAPHRVGCLKKVDSTFCGDGIGMFTVLPTLPFIWLSKAFFKYRKFHSFLGKKSQSNGTKMQKLNNFYHFNIQILAGFVPTNQRNSKVGNTVSLILYWSFIQTISLSFIFWEGKYLVEKFQNPLWQNNT